MKKIKILTTGGTIFAEEAKHKRNSSADTKSKKDELKATLDSIVNVDDLEELYNIDSSDLRSDKIEILANKIIELEKQNGGYEGYLITHGTDTMAYTASLLSYLLQGSKKPIMLTGSMIPLESKGSDATNNIINSAKAILSQKLKGVYVSFGDNIINGARVKKMHTNDLSTFQSPNGLPDGVFETQKNGNKILKLSKNDIITNKSNELFNTFSKKVEVLKLTPTTNLSIFDYYVDIGLDGLILEGYGDGNVPGEDHRSIFAKKFQQKIEKCLIEGMTIVLKSQCPYGPAIHQYKGANILLDKGVLSAKNMTSESAQSKLMWILGNYKEKETIKDIYGKNVVGEFF